MFADIHSKQIDWPEAIWEAWITFEHLHGTVEEIETCLDKIEKAQFQTNTRRAKVSRDNNNVASKPTHWPPKQEAEKAAYQTMQYTAEAQANVPVAVAPIPDVEMSASTDLLSMQVEAAPTERGTKRGAEEEEPDEDSHKKARFGEFALQVRCCRWLTGFRRAEPKPAPLKRFVAYTEIIFGELTVNFFLQRPRKLNRLRGRFV